MADQIVIVEISTPTLELSIPGAATVGLEIPGTQGPPGPQGPAGSASYLYEQTLPLSAWTVTHNLGGRPAHVSVMKSDGREVGAAVLHLNNNQTVIDFGGIPVGGQARLSL